MADGVPAARRTAVHTSPAFAFEVPAVNHTVGATAARNTPSAVHRVPAGRGTHGATPVPATLVAAAAVYIGVAAHQSTMLAYFATFAVSLVPVMRAACPEHVQGKLGRLDACLRRSARLARAAIGAVRADLAADMRRLRDAARGNAVLAAVYDRAEERARFARAAVVDGVGASRTWAEATWSEHKDAVLAACFFLHLVAAVIYTAATVLINAAYGAARIRAPAVLSHLRGVIKKEIGCKKSEEGAVSSSGFKYRNMACLVNTAVVLGISTDILVYANAITGFSFPFLLPCFTALYFTAMMVSDWVFLPDDYNDTGTTADMLNTASRRVGNRGEPTGTAELNVESWRFLWLVMITAYFIDVYLLRATLGPRPLAVAFLALCHLKIINVGKKVQRTPEDDGEGAEGSAEGMNDGGANKWRSTAMAVLAASVAKVAAIGVVLNIQLAALSLASLCITAVLVLISEENLSDLDASGEDKYTEEGAGFARDSTGSAEEEHSNTSSEEHGDSSDEHVKEQRHEEPDYSSGGMDSWDFVEVDPKHADQS